MSKASVELFWAVNQGLWTVERNDGLAPSHSLKFGRP